MTGLNPLKIKRTADAVYFSWGLALFFALVINFPFIYDAYGFIRKTESILNSSLLMFPVCVFLWCIFVSLFSILGVKYLEKPIFIGLTLISSVLSYGYVYYQMVFDDFSPMVGVIEQTNYEQIMPLITPSFLIWFFLMGICPSYVIYKIKLLHPPLWKEIWLKLMGLALYPLFFFLLILPSLNAVQPMLRLSGLAGRLPFQIIPTNFFENIYNHYRSKLSAQLSYQPLGLDAKVINKASNGKPDLVVIVVGETARGMNFQLNGYPKKTNPYTIKEGVISFRNVQSCGTATRVSVPCMFSSLPRAQFIDIIADHQDNLLDIIKRVGIDVSWIDHNDSGGCQGVCKHVDSKILGVNDRVVVEELAEFLKSKLNKDSVVVFHLNGSHGPNYYAKYPPEFARFTPDCKRDELRLCDRESLLNAYDNSILYTDYLLAEMIKLLKKEALVRNTALIYTSDHGESMGEHGLYGHCAPYVIAPKEQTHVPLIIWMSESFASEKGLSESCLHEKAFTSESSHDYLFHSMLGLMDVSTSLYQPQLDLFKSCRGAS